MQMRGVNFAARVQMPIDLSLRCTRLTEVVGCMDYGRRSGDVEVYFVERLATVRAWGFS